MTELHYKPTYEPTPILRFVQRAEKRILQQVWVPWGWNDDGRRTRLPGFIWRDVSLMTEEEEDGQGQCPQPEA